MAENPFDNIEARLIAIEKLLINLKFTFEEKETFTKNASISKYIPIQDIFKNKICSKPTFYAHLKAGEFFLYKFGQKSFVDSEEFFSSFRKIIFNNK